MKSGHVKSGRVKWLERSVRKGAGVLAAVKAVVACQREAVEYAPHHSHTVRLEERCVQVEGVDGVPNALLPDLPGLLVLVGL